MKHNTFKKTLTLASLLLAMQGLSACLSNNGGLSAGAADNSSSSVVSEVTPEQPETETPEIPKVPEVPEVIVREVIPLWEAAVKDGKEWSTRVDQALDKYGQNLLDVVPADRSLFCPKYAKLSYAQRKQYWAFMLSSMVKFESKFNTNSAYREGFRDSKGNAVVSRGLLQLSIESGNAYGCAFKTTKDLHDPFQNLSCGIRILDRWLGRDGRIGGKIDGQWRGGARYWSVLRAADKTSYNSILKWSQELSFCK